MSKSNIKAALKKIDADLNTLDHQDGTRAQDYANIIDKIERILNDIQDQPKLRKSAAAYYRRARRNHQCWKEYEQQYSHIASVPRTGDWGMAITELDSAFGVFGDNLPHCLRQQWQDWQAVVQAIELARNAASEALERAQTSYAAASKCENLLAMAQVLLDALKPLTHAERDFHKAKTLAHAAGGVLPQDVVDLQREVDAYRERVCAVRAAARSLSAWDGWAKARKIDARYGSDPTLTALAQTFKAQIAQDVPEFLRQIRVAIEGDDPTEALDMLHLTRELEPDNVDIVIHDTALQHRQKLEVQLEQVEQIYQSQLAANNLADAAISLRQGMEMLFNTESVLAAAEREHLVQLFRLEGHDERLALGKDEHWQTAQAILAELTHLGSKSWAARRVVQMATPWARLARVTALQGIIAAESELGNYWAAYRAVAAYVRACSTDASAIQQLAEVQECLVEQLDDTANKRLERAQAALQQGEAALALDILACIETEVYGPVAQAFPTLLASESRINALCIRAERHTATAKRLQSLHIQAETHLQAARDAFLEGKLKTAQRVIRAVPDLTELPNLMPRFADLQSRIEQSLTEQFNETIIRVQVELRLFKALEEIEGQCQTLQDLPERIDFRLLSDEERETFEQLLAQVQAQYEYLLSGPAWEAQAEKALINHEYAGAVGALEQALAATRQVEKRVALETCLERTRRLAREHKKQEDALEQGQELFYQGNYAQARRVLQRARGLGGVADGLIDSAWAGELLENARRVWDENGNHRDALLDLEEALDLAEGNVYAEEIAREARRLEKRWRDTTTELESVTE